LLHFASSLTPALSSQYRFEVAPNALLGTLDRFACFFAEPLFNPACTEREVNAVNSEHNANLQSDVWRFFQLEKHLSSPNHPFSKFGTGSIETLWEAPNRQGRDPTAELAAWWKKEYCARRMKLVVVGKEDLDTLTEWVRERFEAVPVRTTDAKSRLVYDNQVLEKEQTGVRYLFTDTAILPINPSSIT
jgi:insulysin